MNSYHALAITLISLFLFWNCSSKENPIESPSLTEFSCSNLNLSGNVNAEGMVTITESAATVTKWIPETIPLNGKTHSIKVTITVPNGYSNTNRAISCDTNVTAPLVESPSLTEFSCSNLNLSGNVNAEGMVTITESAATVTKRIPETVPLNGKTHSIKVTITVPNGYSNTNLSISCDTNVIAPSFATTLPIIEINTQNEEIVDEPKITATMSIRYKGNNEKNTLQDNPDYFNGYIGIEIRGSSSQELFPKKQYAVETREQDGSNLNIELFNMPKENDWILYAPYSDKSLLRNILAYDISRKLERYSSRTQLCEVIINGMYMGLYVWMEKIKRDKDRVDVSKLESDEISGDDLTGGYIIKVDKGSGNQNEGWTSPKGTFFQYHYPDQGDIVTEQKTYIQNYINTFENRIQALTNTTPIDNIIDIDSWVDYAITNELAKNIDGYRLSAYMYKHKDSDDTTLHFGPVWDFNLGFGNVNYYNGARTDGWVFDNDFSHDSYPMPFWWIKIWNHPQFRVAFNNRWNEVRQNVLSTNAIFNVIDTIVPILEDNNAIERNFDRWPILGEQIWPNEFVGNNYEEEINYLKTWINRRLAYIDNNPR